ncbi:hypothetical protein BT93_L5885 [Corymbia citriodora subsp. variegata]|uniref:Uncharacterized protein n=1 Tax=Corymbia citriodora subsp. variegata TaxID=360336 RepID=A0A8T0CR38_CORYI|nr:hypothetical protein BT93_L5885 [Corymbia citriodora subsp. variegata]
MRRDRENVAAWFFVACTKVERANGARSNSDGQLEVPSLVAVGIIFLNSSNLTLPSPSRWTELIIFQKSLTLHFCPSFFNATCNSLAKITLFPSKVSLSSLAPHSRPPPPQRISSANSLR